MIASKSLFPCSIELWSLKINYLYVEFKKKIKTKTHYFYQYKLVQKLKPIAVINFLK